MNARTAGAALLAGSVVMLGGCYDFDAPLDTAPMHALDLTLLGTWRCLPFHGNTDQQPENFVFAASTREKLYSITFGEPREQQERFEAYASEIVGRPVLNVRQIEPTGQERSWRFVRYAFPLADVLHLELVSKAPLRGVDQTSRSLRAALERLNGERELYESFCICVRAKANAPAK
jgi:hypothetical protein